MTMILKINIIALLLKYDKVTECVYSKIDSIFKVETSCFNIANQHYSDNNKNWLNTSSTRNNKKKKKKTVVFDVPMKPSWLSSIEQLRNV